MTVPAGGREAGFVPDGVMEDGSPVTISNCSNNKITGINIMMLLKLVFTIQIIEIETSKYWIYSSIKLLKVLLFNLLLFHYW